MTLKQAHQHLEEALRFRDEGEYKKSRKLVKAIIPIFEQQKEWELYVQAYNISAGCFFYESKFKKALKKLNKALVIGEKYIRNSKELALTYNIFGITFYEEYQLEEAEYYYGKSLTLRKEILSEDDLEIGKLHNNFAAIYLDRGEYNLSMNRFDEALRICERNEDNRDTKKLKAKVYINKGHLFHLLGDYKKALLYTDRALNINITLFPKKHTKIALSFLSIGAIYGEIGNYQKELEYYIKAAKIWKKIDTSHPDLALVYNGIGMYHLSNNENEEALIYFNKSLKIWKKIHENHSEQIFPLRNSALSYSNLGDYTKALLFLKKAHKLQKKTFGKNHPECVRTFCNFCHHFLNEKKFKAAAKYAHRAINTAVVGQSEENIFKNLSITVLKQTTSSKRLLDALEVKGRSLLLWSKQTKTQKIKLLKVAFDTYSLAIQLIDNELQNGFKNEGSISVLFKEVETVYQSAVLVGFRLHQETNLDNYLFKIFEIAEKSKGRLLFGVIRDFKAKANAALPTYTLKEEANLKKQLSFIKSKLNTEWSKKVSLQNEVVIKDLQNQLFDTNLKYEVFISRLENDNPDYFKLKYDVGTIDIDNLQTNLGNNDFVIEYFITENSLYIFYISKNKYGVKHVNTSINWKEKIAELRKHIHLLNYQYAVTAFELYQLLIQPIEDKFTKESKLIIIPDRHLFSIPFEVLLSNKVNEAKEYSTFPYFLNNCKSISYHYSATLWSHTPKYKKTNSFSFAGFAPKYDNTGKYKNLPHSEKELKAIAELLQKETDQVHIFLNERATIQYFIQALEKNDYDVIHIAAHGFQNPLFPSQSGVVFTNTNPDTSKKTENTNDDDEIMRSLDNGEHTENKFYIDQTLALRLNTQLMVLNFCNSGIGKAIEGEGMMAMNRSFLYAGAKNIIYTLMKIGDKDASELAQLFYQYILLGKSYAEALHLAKLDFIKRENTTPKLWCGFVLIGK